MTVAPERRIVSNRQEFLDYLFEILDFVDAIEVEADQVYPYLQRAAQWMNDPSAFYAAVGESRDPDVADWQLFADMLSAALRRG